MNRRALNSAKKNSFFTYRRFATRKGSNVCFLVGGPENPCRAMADGWMRPAAISWQWEDAECKCLKRSHMYTGKGGFPSPPELTWPEKED